jgi:hypothetical protein
VKAKISIRKVLIVLGFMAASTGLVMLLLAANRKEQNHICKDVRITIKGVSDVFYIDKGDIITILKNGSDKKLIGQPLNNESGENGAIAGKKLLGKGCRNIF